MSRVGRLGRIRLNRPSALNSLTLGMVRRFARALDEFGADADIMRGVRDRRGRAGFVRGRRHSRTL